MIENRTATSICYVCIFTKRNKREQQNRIHILKKILFLKHQQIKWKVRQSLSEIIQVPFVNDAIIDVQPPLPFLLSTLLNLYVCIVKMILCFKQVTQLNKLFPLGLTDSPLLSSQTWKIIVVQSNSSKKHAII